MTPQALAHFERRLTRDLEAFEHPEQAKRPKHAPAVAEPGLTVLLAVRERRLAADQVFEHTSKSISRLEATIEAERAAREAGWPIIGYVIDYR